MDKAQLRRELMDCLLAISPEQRSEKSRKACRNLVSTAHFQEASTVMMFVSLPHEVDTSEAILHAWQLGKVVAVPKISWQQRHILAVQLHSLDTGMTADDFGIRTPATNIPISLEEIDLVVTPGIAFDRMGNRLGRGGAYYDRFFSNKELVASRCGLGFSEQIIDSMPVLEHDMLVNFLVTDEEIIYFNRGRNE